MEDNLPPVGKLKVRLIEYLIKAIELGDAHPSLLAVAAKVVKDFHTESAPTQSEQDLTRIVSTYKLRKAAETKASH